MTEEDRTRVHVHLAAELDHSLSDNTVTRTVGSGGMMAWPKEPNLGLSWISWEESSFTVAKLGEKLVPLYPDFPGTPEEPA